MVELKGIEIDDESALAAWLPYVSARRVYIYSEESPRRI